MSTDDFPKTLILSFWGDVLLQRKHRRSPSIIFFWVSSINYMSCADELNLDFLAGIYRRRLSTIGCFLTISEI